MRLVTRADAPHSILSPACSAHARETVHEAGLCEVQAGPEPVPLGVPERQQPPLPHHARPHHQGAWRQLRQLSKRTSVQTSVISRGVDREAMSSSCSSMGIVCLAAWSPLEPGPSCWQVKPDAYLSHSEHAGAQHEALVNPRGKGSAGGAGLDQDR